MKTKRYNLLGAGANRGGNEYTDCYLDQYPPPSRIDVADPKGQRAMELARRWSERGIDAVGYAEPCEKVVSRLQGDYVGMLTVDSILPMAKIIDETSMPVQWQILGRSTSSIIVAFAGTLTSEDTDSRKSSSLVLKNLSTYSVDVSSEHMNTSFLQNRSLKFARREVSRYSAMCTSHLLEGREEGGLRMFLGSQNYPLVAIQGEPAPFREIEKRSLEFEHPKINEVREYGVAYVIANRVELFLIEKYREKKGVKFYTAFGEPVDVPESVSEGTGSGQVKTLVTD